MPTRTKAAAGGASGRFLLRLPPQVHKLLRSAAADAGLSLNDYCSLKLSAPMGGIDSLGDGVAIMRALAERFSDQLRAVAVFGSWSRGEARPESDVDLLVVLEASVELNRKLYRWWDEHPLTWQGHSVEVHFVHLPSNPGAQSGLWAEVALDGAVLFERKHALSRHLAQVRRDIADGRIVRRFSQGRPYWTEVA